ncbi:oxidoreductase [Phyllobacterium sp. LjRoot231]|uniref:oxidoreductase n=1 Tax=Phyllobacterium sp. LjRoot231 TaxID=3342289 RepID=UPI003ED03A34
MTTWLITGCSSGLGRALAQCLLEDGQNVVMSARDPSTLSDLAERFPNAAVSALDVTNKKEVAETVRHALERFGGIDVLVNNAGYGYRAAVEEADDEDVKALLATNFFGPVFMIKAVLPGMRAQRRGTIINVSSIAGRFAAPGSGFYSASKFALEGMSNALLKEVGPLGIRVMVVEPGAFRTDFTGRSLHQSSVAIADYADTAGRRRKENDQTHGTQPGDPVRAARAIVEVVNRDKMPFRLLLGSDAVRLVSAEMEIQRQELDDWKNISLGTDFDAAEREF